MDIAPLGIAIAYLLLVIVGAVGALLLLVWLFGERPGTTGTGRGTTGSVRGADFEAQSTPPAKVNLPEDRAA